MEITILLVEDDYLNRRLSKKVLNDNGYLVLESKNVEETFKIIQSQVVDLVILDICLGEGEHDGISIGHRIKQDFDIPIIYLTAYDNQMIFNRAFETLPKSYITKPFKNIDLIASVEIALKNQNSKITSKELKKILVKDGEYFKEVDVKSICYLESQANYVLVYTNTAQYKMRSTLKNFLEVYNEGQFEQVHRAFVINKDKIDKFNNKFVIVNGVHIPLTKKINNED